MAMRRFWLHEETDKALLLGTTSSHYGPRAWLPKSKIVVLGYEHVRNPNADQRPGASQFLGHLLRVEVPEWLLSKLPEEFSNESR